MLSKGRGKISEELQMILICHEMKWDYDTYLDQPTWFISAINEKMNIENYYKSRKAKAK